MLQVSLTVVYGASVSRILTINCCVCLCFIRLIKLVRDVNMLIRMVFVCDSLCVCVCVFLFGGK